MFDDRFFDWGGEGTRVSDTGGAAVSNEIKSELIQIRLEAGRVQIVGYDPRSGGEGGFDSGIHRKAVFHRLFGEESCGEHDRWVGGICARSDGGNDDGAVPQGSGVIELRFSCNGIGCGAIGEHLLLVGRHGHLGRLSQLFGILAVSPLSNRFGEEVIERGF